MVLKYTGEPCLYSIRSTTQWLQNVITINAEAFAEIPSEITTGEGGKTFEGKAWCHVFFCSNRGKQEISRSIFHSLGLENGQTAKIYHGEQKWEIKTENGCFEEGWGCFCQDNLIYENSMIFLRTKGKLTYDVLPFSETQSQISLRWTLPLAMIVKKGDEAQQPIFMDIVSSINPFLKHDWRAFSCFYQIYLAKYKYKLELPEFADIWLNEGKTPSITLTNGKRHYQIGMSGRCFDKNWECFVADHDLQNGQILVFIPQSKTCFAVVVFDRKGIERKYSWQFEFSI